MTMRKFRQAQWEEPIIFELSREGRVGFSVPVLEPEIVDAMDDIASLVPNGMLREKPPKLPEVSELEVLRHFIHLSQMNYGVNSGRFYPLGSTRRSRGSTPTRMSRQSKGSSQCSTNSNRDISR